MPKYFIFLKWLESSQNCRQDQLVEYSLALLYLHNDTLVIPEQNIYPAKTSATSLLNGVNFHRPGPGKSSCIWG